MKSLIYFGILSLPVILLSWRNLVNIKSHGFYRFFSWECIVGLFVVNYKYWFVDPLGPLQLISWTLLFLSTYLVIYGAVMMKKFGKSGKERAEDHLYGFEKTTELIDNGVFKYIRHPLYASLIWLTWAVFFKNPALILSFVALLSTLFLFLTARFDEKECIAYFGDKYIAYMKRSKMFIPFIL